MYLLSRWDFTEIHGDILSGVYDHYVDPGKRRALGEVFTRPEIARYMLERCEYNSTKIVLDPACRTGTFLVEALNQEVTRLRSAACSSNKRSHVVAEKDRCECEPERAEVAKATFYRHFPSKDELVLAYLSRRNQLFWDYIKQPKPPATIHEALRKIDALVNHPDVGSCPFLRVASEYPDPEHPFHRSVRAQR